MKKKSISREVSKITKGLINQVADLALAGLVFFEEMAPYQGGSLIQKVSRMDRRMGDLLGRDRFRGALRNIQKKGWINENLDVTSKGQERLKSILPQYFEEKKWDGKWYIVSYDIPENKRWLRGVIRNTLRELKFGSLHKSLWISPYNFLGDVEKIINQYNLETYVLLAISDRLGREPSEVLAERIWNLEEINNQYKEFVSEVEDKKLTRSETVFRYLFILQQDPQLPIDLLPSDWQGEKAHRIYKKFVLRNKFTLRQK
jgi:phenylacetic acid degradation operon negative regulatory protein